MSLPSLTALRTFEAAARYRSVKLAAAELHVTPTAVSHQIQQLEDLLGVKLFERTGRGLVLTDAAVSCLPYLQQGFELLKVGVDKLRKHRGPDIITVNTSPSFASLWLFPRLHRFSLLYPDIDVRVTTRLRQAAQLRQEQQSGVNNVQDWIQEADLVIAYGNGQFGGFEHEELIPLYIAPMCSPALLPKGEKQAMGSRLLELPWLHDDRGTLYGSASFWQRWLAAAGLADGKPAKEMHFTHALLALSAAADQLGVVVSTPVLAESLLRDGILYLPFDEQVRIDRSYYLVKDASTGNDSRLTIFKEWLRQEAALSNAKGTSAQRLA
ncbi:LysR family transcriptional regulator [Bordetella parapertussis]|uniref:LysR-family transcriptional regulator n=2 Tax=Bordetella parapertussis TaxID=519 RepID=Q7W4H0_BORPA|nr:LysR family transcriptional regulator [Bordetella parapertussis]AOB40624.1 LysR family transcriptional regulator [Bordetella parapertussis]AUL44657.1 LysR family transcriptional regulator [Bordetella parapertussis]AWP64561.1 LysR family transcriptional regulator [Bordetella parapertussis]AWP72068.1 LysR family transcriptional regulator [Bordetella parapertussis]AWP90668.1 LysR family transcriptional regulator [Bordetella parapertussis]